MTSGGLARIGLGGAQFGLDYGVSNPRGRISEAEVGRLLATAAAAGIATIDTAPAYGESETVIGRLIGADPAWSIVTKSVDLAQAPTGKAAGLFADGVRRSLDRLRRPYLDVLLFHRVDDLKREDAPDIVATAEGLRDAGLIRRLGFSAYDAAEIDLGIARLKCDVAQVPYSLVDQRLASSGHLRTLARNCIEVHARSVFLQGLLLLPIDRLPVYARAFAGGLDRVHRRAADLGLTTMELCLAHARQAPGVAIVLVGVASLGDLEQIVAVTPRELPDLSGLAVADPALVDPRRWPMAG